MTLYEYFVDAPEGRQYFKQLPEANAFAQRTANVTGKPASRRDLNGGQSLFYPESK